MSTHDAWKHYKSFNEKMKMCISGGRFRDKSIFVFLPRKSPVDSTDTLGVKNFNKIAILHCFRDKCVFAFYAEIQDAYKNGAKNDFGEKNFGHQWTLLIPWGSKLLTKSFYHTQFPR